MAEPPVPLARTALPRRGAPAWARHVRTPFRAGADSPGNAGAALGRTMTAIVLAILALVVLAHIAMAALAPDTVAVVNVEREPLVATVVATGRVEPLEPVAVSALVQATALRVAAAEGDTVRAGQLLVVLRGDELNAAASVAQARLSGARARLVRVQEYEGPLAEQERRRAEVHLRSATSDHERTRTLVEAGAAAARELEASAARLEAAREAHAAAGLRTRAAGAGGSGMEMARSDVRAAEAELDAAMTRLGYTRVAAPVDGVVLRRLVEPGSAVMPGTPLVMLSPAGGTRLRVQLDERALASVAPGQRVSAAADARPEQGFAAVVEWVAPAVDRERGTIDVRMHVPAPPPFLRPEMTVSVSIQTRRAAAGFAVPAKSLIENDGPPAVLVVRDDTVRRIPVRVGARGPGRVEVTGALRAGELVVVPGGDPPRVGSRAAVRPWRPATEEKRSGSGIPFH